MEFSKLRVGQKARIVALQRGFGAVRQRLLALGLIPGVEFIVRRKAPLGDPVEIHLQGMPLCLRKEDCQLLEIEAVAP